MITMTNQEILNFANSMFGNKHLPVKIAYAISKNANAVADAVKAYDDTRKKLLDQFAKKDENGEPIITNGQYDIEDAEKWNEEIRELLETETEVAIHTVSIDEFEKCDDPRYDTLTVAEMSILKFMIAE